MKILEIKNDKVKFNSKKENEVLIDVFLKKSFNELTQLWLALDFDEMKKDESWRDYIECKLKVLMGVDNGKCFNKKIEDFYKENILDRFLEKKWINQNITVKKIDLKDYFGKNYEYNKDNIYLLSREEKIRKMERLVFELFSFFNEREKKYEEHNIEIDDLWNWFYWYIDDSLKLIIAYKYRLSFELLSELENLANWDIKEKKYIKKINIYNKNEFKDYIVLAYKGNINNSDILSFLLSKVDLTQDIQEIKIDSYVEFDEIKMQMYDFSEKDLNKEDVDIPF